MISPFHPSFVDYSSTFKPFKRSGEFRVHWVVWVCRLSKFGWKGLLTYLTKKNSWDYWTNSDGVFGKMQIISYSFKVLKHIWELIYNVESYWCWKSGCNFFLTIGIFKSTIILLLTQSQWVNLYIIKCINPTDFVELKVKLPHPDSSHLIEWQT